MNNFTKIVEPKNNFFIIIKFKDGNLSIVGVDRPMNNGDCKGSCGQCIETLWECYYNNEVVSYTKTKLSKDWTTDLVFELAMIWEIYHLNDMKVGTKYQETELVKAGLYNSCFMAKASYCYKHNLPEYGKKCNKLEVPEAVLTFLKNLPEPEHELPDVWKH